MLRAATKKKKRHNRAGGRVDRDQLPEKQLGPTGLTSRKKRGPGPGPVGPQKVCGGFPAQMRETPP